MTHPEPPSTADGFESWPTGRLLSTAARLVEHAWEEVLREHDVTHAGLIALHTLTSGARSQRDLARACQVTDQTMSRTVERLARGGFVQRETDPADERRVRVTITDAGRDTYAQLLAREQDDAALTAVVSDPAGLRRMLVELIRARRAPGP
ncbi:MarR family winged helix-turn-helix transcriptional regulator [Rhodococcus sp. SGAir0479]|uniref:MarR family winged helix-turn-helix transcriptional regulator n=1 Tax=Rhodococcus sp. SGAir0479 TaxID=2567884 RepID=UPI0010CD0C3F|nr:MarR family transcriptional regulator [Rhodococcus sp. SGAir0479]QCQ91051.1 MarR family transcriptional regulator [Rhodococcus sp. SGAir0479]